MHLALNVSELAPRKRSKKCQPFDKHTWEYLGKDKLETIKYHENLESSLKGVPRGDAQALAETVVSTAQASRPEQPAKSSESEWIRK